MNISKNGILITSKPSLRNRHTFQQIPDYIRLYATLTRFEDGHVVWLTVPFYRKEINQLKRDGWRVCEVWKKTT